MKKIRTRSVWGSADPRIYRFLDQLEELNLPKTFCVIGCADGAEVFPAAKRGFDVCAIDIDETALFGGVTKVGGDEVEVKGLEYWSEKLGLEDRIEIVNENIINFQPKEKFTGVLASGLLHYRRNSEYPLEDMITKIKSPVSVGGKLLLEYIHPSKNKNNDPERHFLTKDDIEPFFGEPEWTITSNKVKKYIDTPNQRNPEIHEIVWGKLYAIRNK